MVTFLCEPGEKRRTIEDRTFASNKCLAIPGRDRNPTINARLKKELRASRGRIYDACDIVAYVNDDCTSERRQRLGSVSCHLCFDSFRFEALQQIGRAISRQYISD